MKVIQLLPVNDTTTDGHWHDSYPYNIVSTCALHPHYVDLEAAGVLRSKTQMTQFLRRRQELNALPYSDYEAVGRVKLEYLQQLFEEQGNKTTETSGYKEFIAVIKQRKHLVISSLLPTMKTGSNPMQDLSHLPLAI